MVVITIMTIIIVELHTFILNDIGYRLYNIQAACTERCFGLK